MGCVLGAGREVQEERLVRRHLLRVGDERDCAIGEILGEVIALLGRLLRLNPVVVVGQLRVVLVRVAAHEPVVALKAAAERPALVWTGRRHLIRRRQMPLADGVGVEAFAVEDLRQKAVLERDVAVIAGEAGRGLGDRRHVVRVMVAAVEDARPRRRAERSRVHVRVPQTSGRKAVDVWRLDRAAVTAELREARVVENDEQDVRNTLCRAHWLRPGGARLVERPSDDARKRAARRVLDEPGTQIARPIRWTLVRHAASSSAWGVSVPRRGGRPLTRLG